MAEPSQDWQLEREVLADYRIFRVLRKRGRSPRNGANVDFHSLEMVDWVQVIPITTDGKLLMVDQFRPGAEVNSLEFPAGLIEQGEAPEAAAARELREETGYSAQVLHHIGALYANPAIQSNYLHVVVAEQCVETSEREQDDGEDLHLRIVDPAELPELIAARTINHALVLAAWQLYESWRVQRPASRT